MLTHVIHEPVHTAKARPTVDRKANKAFHRIRNDHWASTRSRA